MKGRDDNNNIDVNDYYRVEAALLVVFLIIILLLDFPSLQVSGNNGELGGIRPSPIVVMMILKMRC
ncbi:hypothetical protein [Borreliella bavariensis]|uniref:hypothetical protein n=1 Tax=Borreliella bavariensis TaxID=664662 RepID=UPI001C0026C2|nr:hypothetical protein [Borreliella bavariensis]